MMKLTSRAHRRARPTGPAGGAVVGLDLGATAVRATVLAGPAEPTAGVPQAQLMVGAPLPPGAVTAGVVTDPSAVTAALKQLWKQHRLRSREVVLGVANPQVLVRDLDMPDLDPAERAQALPFQARELIAMSLDQMVLDFAPLGPSEDGSPIQHGLLVACPREPVLAAIAAVEGAGLEVTQVDLASFALLRAAAPGREEVEVVVDVGAQLTTIVVHHAGVPRLVRTVPRGGEELTARLAERLSVDAARAEEVKCRWGLTGPEDSATVLRDLVAPLLSEIRSSLNYYRTGNPGREIHQVVLTGGGSALPGLGDLVSTQVGVPCDVVSPDRLVLGPAGHGHRDGEPDPRWASALSVGLAIGAAA